MSNLTTLLEAARFVEMQELKEQQHRAAVEAALAASKASLAPPPSKTVVISSSDLTTSTILQSPLITFSESKKDAQPEQHSVVTSTTTNSRPRLLHNSFDIMNPLVIDESGGNLSDAKRRQPPLVFRAGTREVHNKLEKHRRAHLKECFDVLKKQLPITPDEKKTSNLSILHSALKYIQSLKRKERELEHEMERLARDKISAQHRLALLKKDISTHFDNVDFSKILPEIPESATNKDSAYKAESINQNDRIPIPLLPNQIISTTTSNQLKEVGQPVQTTALSVLPVGYPVSQGLVLQKVAIVPKGLTDLTPLVSTHFITQQQLNGKVVPLVNAQYVVKPVVVVSTASPRPS